MFQKSGRSDGVRLYNEQKWTFIHQTRRSKRSIVDVLRTFERDLLAFSDRPLLRIRTDHFRPNSILDALYVTSDCILLYILLVVGTCKILMICRNVIYSRGSKFFFSSRHSLIPRHTDLGITWKRDERFCVASQGVEFFFCRWINCWRSLSRFQLSFQTNICYVVWGWVEYISLGRGLINIFSTDQIRKGK